MTTSGPRGYAVAVGTDWPSEASGEALQRRSFLADLLFHLHLHDNTGTVDHIEIGTGKVDWRDLVESLAAIRYQGSMMLEMNPDRVTPEGIRRSGQYVADRWPARGT